MGVVRRRLLRAQPTSPCKLLYRGSAPLRDQGLSVESPHQVPLPGSPRGPSQPHSASPAQARPTLVTLERPPVPRAGPHPTQGPRPRSPSGGSSPLGPEGWKPPRAHSIICLFWISTTLDVSVSSFSGHAGKIFPARLLATCRGCRCHPPPHTGGPVLRLLPHCPTRQAPASGGPTWSGTSTRDPQHC